MSWSPTDPVLQLGKLTHWEQPALRNTLNSTGLQSFFPPRPPAHSRCAPGYQDTGTLCPLLATGHCSKTTTRVVFCCVWFIIVSLWTTTVFLVFKIHSTIFLTHQSNIFNKHWKEIWSCDTVISLSSCGHRNEWMTKLQCVWKWWKSSIWICGLNILIHNCIKWQGPHQENTWFCSACGATTCHQQRLNLPAAPLHELDQCD